MRAFDLTPSTRCPIARHRTIKDIEEISGQMVPTVRCRSARHCTVVIHKMTLEWDQKY